MAKSIWPVIAICDHLQVSYDRGNLLMTARDVQKILGARVLTGEEFLDREITSACASDMMSDVLAYGQGQSLLLTGLLNQQVIRTAEMLDMHCIIFVRGKTPAEEVLTLAREKGIAVISTQRGMFTASGLLYGAGLRGV